MVRTTSKYLPALTHRNARTEGNEDPWKRKPVPLRQLCAIARQLLEADLSMDDAEWRERIKCRIIQLDLTYPQPLTLLGEAMTRVDRALKGQRPSPLPPSAPAVQEQQPQPLTTDEARAALSLLRQTCGAPPPMKAMPSPDPQLMTTRERYATVSLIEQLRTLHQQKKTRALTPQHLEDREDQQ